MEAYMICSKCNGIKWIQMPEGDSYDGTAGAVPMKGCTCPPEPEPKPKPEFTMTIACPHCGKYVIFDVRGDITFDFGEAKEI